MIQPSLQPAALARAPQPVAGDLVAAGQGVHRMRPPAGAPSDEAPALRRSLGSLLLEDGAVTPGNLLKAIVASRREHAPLAEVLLARRWVTRDALERALCAFWRTGFVDLAASPPDPRLIDSLGPRLCLSQSLVPWRRIGGVTLIACARPESFAALEAKLCARLGAVHMMLADERQVQAAILALRETWLLRDAETCVPAALSCRSRNAVRTGRLALALSGLLAAGSLLAPTVALLLLTIIAVLLLGCATCLRILAFQAWLRGRQEAKGRRQAAPSVTAPELPAAALPVISVMVPMFREADIAPRLVGRLSALTYPRERTDILLVVEEGDSITREALACAALPRWIRVIAVPKGRVQTKPRALNYGLNFCRGNIIGVWDAEDQPEPDQLHRIARRFAAVPPEVACLQGVLDYYEPKTNWISRCFTLEYGSWFRAILPGMARLGLVVPLGGTTMFVRRDALEAVGGWDAWNVTEDADLGMRLVRRGYRTEIIDTVTREEPNCRARAWVRQRSRWHKGYFMTWATHMRAPRQLLRDIGWRPFLAFQLQMAGVVAGFLLAPVLWSFWLIAAGLPHPLAPVLAGAGGWLMPGLFTLFVASALISMIIAAATSLSPGRRHLLPFVPTTGFYFMLGCLAAWKAAYEVVADPFYWDKTAHGMLDTGAAPAETVPEGALVMLHARRMQHERTPPPPERIAVLGQIG